MTGMRYAIHTLLSRTAHLMRNDLRPHLSAIGLSPGQPKVLRSLMTREPLSSGSWPITARWIPPPSAGCWRAWSGTAF